MEELRLKKRNCMMSGVAAIELDHNIKQGIEKKYYWHDIVTHQKSPAIRCKSKFFKKKKNIKKIHIFHQSKDARMKP